MGIIESMRLDGKKGFVTGGARGIGKCTATGFCEAGADLAIVDLDLETAKKTAAEISDKTGRKFIAIYADVTKDLKKSEFEGLDNWFNGSMNHKKADEDSKDESEASSV